MANKIEEAANKLHENALDTLKRLDAIWDELGLDDDIRAQRNCMFFKHVADLFAEMLVEAEDCKANLLENIASLCKELSDIGRDLRVDIPIEGYENVPLCRVRQELKATLPKYQEEHDMRKAEIKTLLAQERKLCKALGRHPKELQTVPLPSREELLDFQAHLEALSDLKFRREEHFFRAKARIADIMGELQIKPSLDFERTVVECEDAAFTVTDEHMLLLDQFQQSLETQLTETRAKVAELRERITLLWERLEESAQARSAFLHRHTGTSVATLLALKATVAALEERKRANIKLFVDKMRRELVEWWDKCRSSPQERADFLHYHCDVYTEDLLTLHEIQAEKLRHHYETNAAIYDLYERRENLWRRLLDLEHRASLPDRYKNRGGQLLAEERERKTIACQLPKIEHELLALVRDYEQRTSRPFLVFGQRVELVVEQAWQQHADTRKLQLSARKQLRERTPSKPAYSQSQLTPSGCAGKRKLDTPSQGTLKRSRLELTSSTLRSQGPSATHKKVSLDKQRRLDKVRKQWRQHGNKSLHDYEHFQQDLAARAVCRSSMFPERLNRTPQRRVLGNVNCTPQRKALLPPGHNTPQKTPVSRQRCQSRGAMQLLTPRLAAAPSNLPIII